MKIIYFLSPELRGKILENKRKSGNTQGKLICKNALNPVNKNLTIKIKVLRGGGVEPLPKFSKRGGGLDQWVMQKFQGYSSSIKKCDQDCDQALIKSSWGSVYGIHVLVS